MKKKYVMGVALVAATALLAACGNSKQTAGNDGQTVRRMARDVISSMDPAHAADNVAMQTLTDTVSGLYRFHGNKLQPDMAAQKASISADQKTYTFHLRKNAKWSDGKQVTAQDFVYAWKRAVDPATKSEYAYVYTGIQNADAIMAGKMPAAKLGVKAINKTTFQVHLDHVIPYFESLVTLNVFSPLEKSVVDKSGKKFGTKSSTLTFNGPYKLGKWSNEDGNWTEVKNPDYWNAKNVHVNKIKVQVVKDASTAVNLYQGGKLDDAVITGDTATQMVNDPDYKPVKLQRSYFIEMNQGRVPALKNQKVRQALSLAINRKSYLKRVLGDGSSKIQTVVPSGLFTSSVTGKDFATETGKAVASYTDYDLAKARKLMKAGLQEAGIDKFSFTLTADDLDAGKNSAQYLQGAWTKAFPQLTVHVKSVPANTRLALCRAHNFDVVLATWGADFPDAINYLDLFTTGNDNNDGQWSNKQYDALIKASNTTHVTNPTMRWNDLSQASHILIRDMGVIPLYQAGEAHLTSKTIKHMEYGPNNLIDFVGVTNQK